MFGLEFGISPFQISQVIVIVKIVHVIVKGICFDATLWLPPGSVQSFSRGYFLLVPHH